MFWGQNKILAGVENFEIPTFGFGDRCSTSELHPYKLVKAAGFEPAISSFQKKRINQTFPRPECELFS